MAFNRDDHYFIDPIDELRLPKLKQLQTAKKYFKILPFEFSLLSSHSKIKNSITKPLGSSEVGDKVFYTSKLIQEEAYRPYPWFFQEGVLEGHDVTCVYINGEVFSYYCDYDRNIEKIDWRVEINEETQSKWHVLNTKDSTSFHERVAQLMEDFKLNYGRLDFLKRGDDYYFLECNCNGQFGWLDDQKELTLHNKFVNAFLS
ncbi:hypothetical protein N9O43_02320 [Burkholderiales bacterium]|nr:hypothetical protein [Burkholderiales bacterium]